MPFFDGNTPPGGRGKITLEVKTVGYRDRVRKSAMVVTNDPDRAQFSIGLEATVIPVFSVGPQNRFHVITPLGQPAGQTVNLTSNISDPVEIGKVIHNLGNAAEFKIEPIQPGRVYSLTMTATAREAGKRGGFVHLELKGAPVASLDLSALVEITAAPGSTTQ